MAHEKPSADEIAEILDERIFLDGEVSGPVIRGVANAAAVVAERADVWCALAYADGYAAALNDCDRAEVGKLISRVAELEGRLAFERAQRQIAERQFENAAAMAAQHSS